jgi:hypothetical protein
MAPHQSFTDICVISLMILSGKISMTLAQAIPPADWFDKLTGPLGAFVSMCIGIYYMAQRNAKQDIKTDEIRKAQEVKDEAHLVSRIESMRIMTEALESTKSVVAQNNMILAKTSKALDKHKCATD